jgi:hypothetical protein
MSKNRRNQMKRFMIFVLSFTFALIQLGTADDIVRSKPAAERGAQPSARVNTVGQHSAAGVHSPIINAGHNRLGLQPNLNVRRNYSAFTRPLQRGPLAMNVQRSPRNYQPKQTPGQLQQPPKVNVATSNTQTANSNRRSYFDALRRCRHERHDCNWWKQHCTTIVFVRTGYYYLDAGYWYPALGYDPAYNYYDYDGPIYTYGNLLPDQVIVNVQRALQDIGYYVGPITGSLGPATRAALANFQRDYGLVITAAIDEPTIESLGLN